MKFIAVSIACILAGASAFEYPEFVPLHKRQEPGTPAYECHANCGGIITDARSDGYCDKSDFKTKLNDCLDCALEFDIWKYYGNSVSSAAEECGLDATPVEGSSSSSSSSSASETATETSSEAESSSTPTESATESTSASETTDSSTTVSSTPVIPTVTTPATTTPGSSSSSSPTPDPEFTGAAALNRPAGIAVGGLIGSLMVALM
ncbi:hypothetical protein ASPVEDRAFT_26134 [Aspergillus versicolor CBS 583.65]|uniref:Extracellular membrane protein CFEM domain-containing protein n=1 Tax=Aspergillus versicolor CBS 583.65 TaxID=1036611 RepID=A0A1L9PCQ9_ASPVE|nr:uncharacterized protein ASPVEDRAFT_26134 [Aspergillus versicolor CBS 583.65]OJI99317.1 hypothetical protein ASPVEDRAFT_26134 [Aspergillus versicolor CBS 583.65]